MLYAVFGFLVAAFDIFILIDQFEATVSCVPDDNDSVVQMIAKNVLIVFLSQPVILAATPSCINTMR